MAEVAIDLKRPAIVGAEVVVSTTPSLQVVPQTGATLGRRGLKQQPDDPFDLFDRHPFLDCFVPLIVNEEGGGQHLQAARPAVIAVFENRQFH